VCQLNGKVCLPVALTVSLAAANATRATAGECQPTSKAGAVESPPH